MRILDHNEFIIVQKKAHRGGTVLNPEDLTVEYKVLFPRITLCIIHDIALGMNYYGATMRSKHDKDNPLVGYSIAFVRAINDIIAELQ